MNFGKPNKLHWNIVQAKNAFYEGSGLKLGGKFFLCGKEEPPTFSFDFLKEIKIVWARFDMILNKVFHFQARRSAFIGFPILFTLCLVLVFLVKLKFWWEILYLGTLANIQSDRAEIRLKARKEFILYLSQEAIASAFEPLTLTLCHQGRCYAVFFIHEKSAKSFVLTSFHFFLIQNVSW